MVSIAYELIERTAAGSNGGGTEAASDRFENEYRQWFGPLVSLCRYQLRGRGDAEAVAQEAFVRAWLSREQYTDGRPFWPWLATIARRLCVNSMVADFRRRDRDLRAFRQSLPQPWTVEDLAAAEDAELEEALSRLAPRDRRLLVERHVDGLSYDEMARLHSVSVESIRGSLKRARATLRVAYERTSSGALAGLLLPWRRLAAAAGRAFGLAGNERAGAFASRLLGPEALALVALLLAPTVPDAVGVGNGRIAIEAPAATTTTLAAPYASPLAASLSEPGAALRASRPAAAAAPAPRSPDGADAAVGTAYRFTASPSYSEDRTVFAMGGGSGGCTFGRSCAVLLKSTDGGRSWSRLKAEGADSGSILLPPAYPRDNRIFSVSWAKLSVSYDGGETFTTLLPLIGTASLSPRFSDDDPRVLITHLDHPMALPVASEYRMDHGVTTPLALTLPPDARPMRFSFGPHYATDGTLFVSVVEAPDFDDGKVVGHSPFEGTVYACKAANCTRLFPVTFGGTPEIVWAQDEQRTMVTWTSFSLSRSSDGGATFTPMSMPGTKRVRLANKLSAAPGGRLIASILEGDDKLDNRLYESNDLGTTWAALATPEVDPDKSLGDVIVLPDGAILASVYTGRGSEIRCSMDGHRWADRCGAA